MSTPNGDTLPQDQKPEIPGTDGNTPPKQEPSQEPAKPAELPEEAKKEIERANARAATAQKQAEDAKKALRQAKIALKKEKGGASTEGGENTPQGSGGNDPELTTVASQATAQIMSKIAFNQQYQELLQRDATLRDVISRNPLSLISEFVDAEDAVDQLIEYLDKRVENAGSGAPAASANSAPAPEEKPKGNPPTPGQSTDAPQANPKMEKYVNMSPEQWAKLPPEERRRVLAGDIE